MSKISMRKIIEDTHPNWDKIYNKVWKKAFDYEAQFGTEDVRKEFFMDFAQLTVWHSLMIPSFVLLFVFLDSCNCIIRTVIKTLL